MLIAKIIGLPIFIALGAFLIAVDTFDDGSTTVLSLLVGLACFAGALLCLPPSKAT